VEAGGQHPEEAGSILFVLFVVHASTKGRSTLRWQIVVQDCCRLAGSVSDEESCSVIGEVSAAMGKVHAPSSQDRAAGPFSSGCLAAAS
jgi:hypothetical protein